MTFSQGSAAQGPSCLYLARTVRHVKNGLSHIQTRTTNFSCISSRNYTIQMSLANENKRINGVLKLFVTSSRDVTVFVLSERTHWQISSPNLLLFSLLTVTVLASNRLRLHTLHFAFFRALAPKKIQR